MKSRFRIPCLGIFLFVGACASGPRPLPTIVTGPQAEVTLDGLYKLDNTVMALAYATPDLDLRPYTKFMLDPVDIAYERDPRGASRPGTASGNFELTPRQTERLKELFSEAIVETLTREEGYPLVEQPGPDVLRLTVSLIDLVVRVPTDVSGRSRVFAASYGEVTMIVEVRDSETGEILVRAGDRQDPTRRNNAYLAEVSPTFVRTDVQRMLRRWAQIMRDRLDQIREVGGLSGA